MSFALTPPSKEDGRHIERLVCSECHLAYGVAMPLPPRKGRSSVYCWLIREGGARSMLGVKKIA